MTLDFFVFCQYLNQKIIISSKAETPKQELAEDWEYSSKSFKFKLLKQTNKNVQSVRVFLN